MSDSDTKLVRPKSQLSETVKIRVTPELANLWLETNDMNRKVSEDDVKRYAADMSEGRWLNNGDPIKFDKYDVLVDGQHRLLAVARSGQTIEFDVKYDLDPRTRLVTDDGRKRKFADDLAMNGVTHSGPIEALLRKILVWEHMQALSLTGGPKRVSRSVLAERYEHGLSDSVDLALTVTKSHPKVPAGKPAVAFVVWLLIQAAPVDIVHKYLRILAIGSQEEADLALVGLREKLERNRLETTLGMHRSYTAIDVYFMLVGYNRWIIGDRTQKYQLPAGGIKIGDPFPLPVKVEAK